MTENCTTKEKVINAICLTGQYPFAMYKLISDESTSAHAVYRAILDMKAARVLSIGMRGGEVVTTARGKKVRERAEKTIRLDFSKKDGEGNPEAWALVCSTLGEETYEHYMAVSHQRNFSGGPYSTYRDLRQAEILMICQRAGAMVFRFERTGLVTIESQIIKELSYYTSREILKASGETLKLTSRSRYYGLLFGPGGVYATFNYTGENARGSIRVEESTRSLLSKIVQQNWKPPQSKASDETMLKLEQAILFGHNPDVVLSLITQREAPKHTYQKEREGKAEAFASIEKVYHDVFYVPFNEDGVFQIWLLGQRDWRARLVRGLIAQEFLGEKRISRTYDAYIHEDRQAVLCWIDANINDLKGLKKEMARNTDTKYAVMCLPWQETIVKQVLGDKVQTDVCSKETVRQIFEKGGI